LRGRSIRAACDGWRGQRQAAPAPRSDRSAGHRLERPVRIVGGRLRPARRTPLGLGFGRGGRIALVADARRDRRRQRGEVEARSRSLVAAFLARRGGGIAGGLGRVAPGPAGLEPARATVAVTDERIFRRLVGGRRGLGAAFLIAAFAARLGPGPRRFHAQLGSRRALALFIARRRLAVAAFAVVVGIGLVFVLAAVFAAGIAVAAVGVAALLPAIGTRLARVFLALPLVGDHAEVMVGELEVVLLGHPVAVEMRVERELAVLLKHLRRVAARPAVDPVDRLAALLTIVVTPAAPAVIPTIVVQG
jgi:hypothetical protein